MVMIWRSIWLMVQIQQKRRTTTSESIAKWKWVQFNGKKILCDYLNNPEFCQQEYRFATQEEVVRVVLYQRSRWK